MFNGFDQIKTKVASAGVKKNVVLWGADEPGWLKTLDTFQSSGLVSATLLGDEMKIRKAAGEAGIDLGKFGLQNVESFEDALKSIKGDLQNGRIDILVRGNIGVKDSLHGLFAREVGFRVGKSAISAVSCHYVKEINRLLIVSDPVVNPVLDLNKKIEVVNNAVNYAHKLGNDFPKVALLAAVEVVYPVMPHTIEAAAIAKMNERGQIKGCLIDGPLSMDVAVMESAAREKGVKGQVAGQAEILIAPTIETAYGMYQAFTRFVVAPSGCIVTGGKIPYCITSRLDSEETKMNSILMAML